MFASSALRVMVSATKVGMSFTPASMTARLFSSKVQGTVKWFDVKKGYGFIAPVDGSAEVFVHQSNIKADGFRSLGGKTTSFFPLTCAYYYFPIEGETVEFTVSADSDKNGKKFATNVTGK